MPDIVTSKTMVTPQTMWLSLHELQMTLECVCVSTDATSEGEFLPGGRVLDVEGTFRPFQLLPSRTCKHTTFPITSTSQERPSRYFLILCPYFIHIQAHTCVNEHMLACMYTPRINYKCNFLK